MPHLLSAGAIIEVCEKGHSTPSYILITQRGTKGTHGQGLIHFSAGFVEPGELPQQTVVREIQKEVLPGVKEGEIKFVGPKFRVQRNQANPLAMTTLLDEVRANPTIVYVTRVEVDPAEIPKMAARAEEGWETKKGGVILLKRDPKAIKDFLDGHRAGESKIWYPGALRRYLTELMPDWRRKLR